MAFFQCPKCKNKWQHNISKCPDCFLDVKRLKSRKIKVIGISEIKIPAILHLKTPYFVLVLEDEQGNRWTQKSIKEYKINDEFSIKPSHNKKAVSLWKVKYDILEAIEKTIELLGGLEINKGSKILILPTLISAKHPHFADNTTPEFLEAAIKFLVQCGADLKNIKIAGQSFNDVLIEASAQKSQILNIALKYKIAVLNLAKTKFIKKEINGLTVQISEQAFKNDLIINLPKLKLDPQVIIKGATNNILTLLDKKSYLSLKDSNYERVLKKINEVLPEYLSLAEGISIQRSDKIVVSLGLAFASFNSLNLDRIFAEIAIIKNLPEYLKDIKIEHIPTTGRHPEELQYNVEKIY
ncbi:MAG: DUF362 domain-containing protein [Candidatus Nealsonbacteria bacterium]